MFIVYLSNNKDDIHVYLSNNKDDIHVYLSNNKDDIHVHLSKNKDDIRGMIVSYLCAQLAVLYTYNCLLILIYYRLGQNLLIINKYAERSQYSWWPIQIGLAYIITLFTITSLISVHHHSIHYNLVGWYPCFSIKANSGIPMIFSTLLIRGGFKWYRFGSNMPLLELRLT